MSDDVKVSIIIVTYNSNAHLDECLNSILAQSYTNYEIILVDNVSTDQTVINVRSHFPGVIVVETGKNHGYSGGNNIGFMYAKGKYLVVVNPDTVADKNWLKELIRPLEEDKTIDITTPKILLYDKIEHINTCANSSHYTGLDFCRGLNQPSISFPAPEIVGAISGCSFAIRREVLDILGGFDPDFFLYLEDTDLSWRARLAGYHIQYVPSSVIYHKYKVSIAPWKEFYLERNRYIMLLKNYQWKTILMMLPPLMVTETIAWGHSIINGLPYVFNKIWANYWIVIHFKDIMEKRRKVQLIRKIDDREFIRLLDYDIPFEQVISNRLLRKISGAVFNTFYRLYFLAMKKIV